MAKPLASTGFLAVALASGGLDSVYGRIVLLGLALGAIGDIALLFDRWFLVGLAVFAASHVAYVIAFSRSETFRVTAAVAAVAVAVLASAWILPHTSGFMRGAVFTYIVLISAMIGWALSVGDWWLIPVGGTLSCRVRTSLLARERFIVSDASKCAAGAAVVLRRAGSDRALGFEIIPDPVCR